MADFKVNQPGLTYGQTIGTGDIAASAVTGAKIAASTVSGSNLTTNFNYCVIAVQSTSAAVNVLGTTAPIAGTITGFFTIASGATSNGTCTLWGTTAGTIATVSFGSTVGICAGTTVLGAQIAAGDTVITRNSVGTVTSFITFQASA